MNKFKERLRAMMKDMDKQIEKLRKQHLAQEAFDKLNFQGEYKNCAAEHGIKDGHFNFGYRTRDGREFNFGIEDEFLNDQKEYERIRDSIHMSWDVSIPLDFKFTPPPDQA